MNKIEDIIYEINGELVVLDSDLAKLYKIETKRINETYKRNKEKFNNKQTWILTDKEINELLVAFSDQKIETRGRKFKNPRVFTTSGIKLLSSIIRIKDKEKITEEILTAFSRKNEILTKSQNTLILTNNNEYIKNMIYEINGIQVMIDSDLAILYETETKRINEAVKNNIEKFPERFSWILSENEKNNLRSKFSTSSLKNNYGGRRYNIRVFTETGVAMLATILKTKVATKISIAIMDAFVEMRHIINNNNIYVNNMLLKHDNDIELLKKTFNNFYKNKITNEIYFKGQIYDAYSKIIDIFKSAEKELIIIDGYSDKTTLDMIKYLKCQVTIITKENKLLNKLDIEKYNKQYHNLKVYYNNNYHDRYFILDNKIIYHCGASINYAGSKTFSINELLDNKIKKLLIDDITKIKT